jgi:hypothetical protein
MLAGFLILRPAVSLAKMTRARKLKVDPRTVPEDEVYGLTAVYAVIIYVVGWWFIEVTGILSYLTKSLS